MSSDSFTEESKKLRPTVQVGDPFTVKLLLEACLELFKTDYVIGIQDMGAAGLTSSSFEMAGRSGSGMIMHLDKVPAREEGMTPYEFMLSESQERMLICAKKGTEDKIIEIFKKWDLDAETIGEVTDTGRMELFWHGEKVADIPVDPVSEEAPILDRPTKEPEYLKDVKDANLDALKSKSNQEIFDTLIKSLDVVDKAWVYNQYDSTVQTNTEKHPGSLDASVIRVKENGKALAMSSDCNPRYCYIDPFKGGALAVMESGRNVAMSGARPLAITDCLNFGNPENPEVMWQFAKATDGIKEACEKLNTPVVSGNVSLYNETNGVSIYPTPAIAMVGVNDDQEKVLRSEFKNSGDKIVLLGKTKGEFGASLALKEVVGEVKGEIAPLDYDAELKLWDIVIKANEKGLVNSAKDLGLGGLAIAVAKSCAISNIGATVKSNLDKNIFDESQSRAIVTVSKDKLEELLSLAKEIGIEAVEIGEVGGDSVEIDDVKISLTDLKDTYFNRFKEVIEQDL
jgi:phosphoribosylformylglycinamidine synthase